MCAKKLILAAALEIHNVLLSLPQLDKDGRRPTLNKHGFADTRFNQTQLEFIEYAKRQTQRLNYSNFRKKFQKQPAVLEIGGAFGDLGIEIVKEGGHYIYLDMSEEQRVIADERLSQETQYASQYYALQGRVPLDPEHDAKTLVQLNHLRDAYEIVGVGMFSVAMYLSGPELRKVFKQVYDLLPSGGSFYMTAITPYCNLFPGYEPVYERNRQKYELVKHYGGNNYFPGWIPDVSKLGGMIPPNYYDHYPNYFHLIDAGILIDLAHEHGFRVNWEASRYMRRLYPGRLRYRGDQEGVGELTSLVAEKV